MERYISPAKGIFVFSSTIIGAGILALPIAATQSGFPPLLAVLLAIAVVAMFSGMYIAEAVLAAGGSPHLPALAREHLGPWGMVAMLAGTMIYIYGALIGYLAAGGQIFFTLSKGAIPVWAGTLIYFAVASVIVGAGMAVVSAVGTALMYAMLMLIGILIAMALPAVRVPLLLRADWLAVLDVFGVVLFAYLGHSVIPSIACNLKRKTDIVRVVLAGIAIPCLMYALWSLVVLGVIPLSSPSGVSLIASQAAGQPATIPLGLVLGGSVILLGNIFAAFSTLTSYTGFGVSLKDAYGDLAATCNRPVAGSVLTALVVVPPLAVALYNPNSFVRTLEIAGTYGGGLFIGIMPVLIVLKLRRRAGAGGFRTWGGNAAAYAVLAVYVFGMLYTTARLLGMGP